MVGALSAEKRDSALAFKAGIALLVSVAPLGGIGPIETGRRGYRDNCFIRGVSRLFASPLF